MNTGIFIYLEFLRKTLLHLPEVTEKLCHGTPAFYVGKNLFTRIREDGETLVVSTREREKWISAHPNVYFVTEHYYHYDYVLVNIALANPTDLEELLIAAWRNRATKKAIRSFEQGF